MTEGQKWKEWPIGKHEIESEREAQIARDDLRLLAAAWVRVKGGQEVRADGEHPTTLEEIEKSAVNVLEALVKADGITLHPSEWKPTTREFFQAVLRRATREGVLVPEEKYSPDQPRDEQGRWASLGGASASLVERLRPPEGGFSVQPVHGYRSPTTGYMVSRPRSEGHEAQIPADRFFSPKDGGMEGEAIVEDYLEERWPLFAENEEYYFGGWYDGETRSVYLDVSERYNTREEALHAGRIFEQRAIYDIEGGTSIAVKERSGPDSASRASPEEEALAVLPGRASRVQEVLPQSGGIPEAGLKYSPDQPRDEGGRWTSMGGGGAAPKELAQRMHAHAIEREPSVTPILERLAASGGGRMEGLEFRIKREESLERKIRDEAEANGIAPEEQAEEITDALRYTMVFPSDEFTEGVLAAQAQLEEEGYEQYDHRFRNYFAPGNTYNGYNTVMHNPETGTRFELQFHTPESLEIKDTCHRLYEEWRVLPRDDPGRGRLIGEMRGLWQDYDRPAGWERLPGVRMDGT